MLPLPAHLTTTLLKTYLLQFLLFRTLCSLFNKKLQDIQKGKKNPKKQKTHTHFEEPEQTSKPESDMTGMLKLSHQEFLNTRISMLRALMEKVNNMEEQMDNIGRGIKRL